jgi:hypothetical protein
MGEDDVAVNLRSAACANLVAELHEDTQQRSDAVAHEQDGVRARFRPPSAA